MNDDTAPPPDGPSADGTDEEWDDDTLRELRSVPDDMDELFARRAITTAIESVLPDPESASERSAGSGASRRSRRGHRPRRLVTLGAAAAVLLVMLVVAVSTTLPRDRSSLATRDRADDASGMSADAIESTGGREGGDRYAGTAGRAGTSDALPHPIYLGRFGDIDDLMDRSREAARSIPRTSGDDAAEDPGGAGEDRGGIPPTVSSPAEGVTECTERLAARGLTVIGWAVLDDARVVVAEDRTSGTVQVFDAMTCTA